MSLEIRPEETPERGAVGGVKIPLHATTWDMDRGEGAVINDMQATHLEPYAIDAIQVSPEFERNVVVTSVDALLNWGRKSSIFPLTFGLACCAFEMIASAMSRFDIARFGIGIARFTIHPRRSRTP